MDLVSRSVRGAPLFGMVADSGMLTRLGVEAGIDFLLCLSAGCFRNQGAAGLAPFLPFANVNDLTEEWLHRQVLPRAGGTAVYCGVLAGDPTAEQSERLARLKRLGVAGVVNYPSVTLLDGSFRQIFEEEGSTMTAKLELLQQARQAGLSTLGFVGPDAEAARQFAAAGLTALVLTPGLTREFEDIQIGRAHV